MALCEPVQFTPSSPRPPLSPTDLNLIRDGPRLSGSVITLTFATPDGPIRSPTIGYSSQSLSSSVAKRRSIGDRASIRSGMDPTSASSTPPRRVSELSVRPTPVRSNTADELRAQSPKPLKSRFSPTHGKSVHGPFAFHTSSKDVSRDLKKLGNRLRQLRITGLPAFSRFEPADGRITAERLKQWDEERRIHEMREYWNTIRARDIRDEDCKPVPHPEYCIAGETDRAYEFRCRYSRNRNNGFELDPWKAAGVPKERWNTHPDITSHGRSNWDWKNGLAKSYRDDEKWRGIDFNEVLDLAPEEVSVEGHVEIAVSWIHADDSDDSLKSPDRTDSGFGSNSGGGGGSITRTATSSIRNSMLRVNSGNGSFVDAESERSSLAQIYQQDIDAHNKQHPLRLRRRFSHALETTKRRATVMQSMRRMGTAMPESWGSVI